MKPEIYYLIMQGPPGQEVPVDVVKQWPNAVVKREQHNTEKNPARIQPVVTVDPDSGGIPEFVSPDEPTVKILVGSMATEPSVKIKEEPWIP